jgi:carboxyl-terminal processing protease
MIPPDVGYVRVAAFGPGVVDRLKAQVDELSKAGAKSLIVDIRHTAEGAFDTGLDAARLFVSSGTLAIKAARDDRGGRETVAAGNGDGAIKLPVTLLVTTGTSGAAELFAAALDGNKRADLVGERTLGRAGIQKLVRLPDGRGLWLTYARYLTPAGDAIQGKGLSPDVEVDEPETDFGDAPPAKDAILDAALDRIHKNAA